MTTTKKIQDMAAMLRGYGPTFDGGSDSARLRIAEEWVEADFTADHAEQWVKARVWDADTAAKLNDEGLTPDDLTKAVESMTDGLDDDARRKRWTDGCPIYSVCNGDTSAQDIIDAAKE